MAKNTDEVLLRLVGDKIRELRKSKKLSLRDLAYRIGMESSNLSVIENGRSNPQLLTYAKIAAALDVSLSDIFDVTFDFSQLNTSESVYNPRKHNPKN
jgi:transcriptional regulator with XRE-family HTH domain